MKGFLIEVKGEIVAYAGTHYAQNWAALCFSSDVNDYSYSYDETTHTVNSDLILNESRRAVPYATYYTNKGISAKITGNINAYPGYGAALEYYKENIDKMSKLLKCNIPKYIEQTFFHGLFVDIFSILELFLSDFILCMIYYDESIYEKAILYYKTSKEAKNGVSEIEKKVHKFFFSGVVYHRFDIVKKMFMELMDIEFPDTSMLCRFFLHKRNNIVHRLSFSSIDRMEIITITKKTVEDLIKETNLFVYKLVENTKAKYPYA